MKDDILLIRSLVVRLEELSAAATEAEVALKGDSNDAEHDALVSMYEAFTGKAAPQPEEDEMASVAVGYRCSTRMRVVSRDSVSITLKSVEDDDMPRVRLHEDYWFAGDDAPIGTIVDMSFEVSAAQEAS